MSNLKIVFDLITRFNNEGIRYCHWKSNQHFCDALTGIDDLDILIDRSQYGQIMSIIYELRFKHFYTPSARTYVGIEDYIGFDYEQGNLVHLHLHIQLVVGEKHLKGFHLPIETEVIAHRRYDEENAVYMSSYYHELLLLILRMGMKVRRRDIINTSMVMAPIKEEFNWLKERCPEFLDELNNEKWLTERIKSVVRIIYNGNFSWAISEKLKQYLYSDIAPYSQGGGFHNTVMRNYREAGRIVLETHKRFLGTKYILTRRRPATGGLTIAFLGADGAGKSTSISEIYSWLNNFIDVRLFYLGSGEGNSSILRSPLKVGLKVAKKLGIVKNYNNFSDEKLGSIKNEKLSEVRKLWVYTLSAERIRKLTKANRCKIRGFVVLTDRYPQSEFDGLCDGPRMSKESGFVAYKEEEAFRIAKLCSPDLVIKLIVSPEEAMKRKPKEITYETSEQLTKRIKQIKFSDRTTIAEIDADRMRNEVLLDIKRSIWNNL